MIILVHKWLDLQFHDQTKPQIKKPDELQNDMPEPPDSVDENIFDRIAGSIIGLALGDALGAYVECQPHAYLVAHPVKDLQGGGTWGLQAGQVKLSTSHHLYHIAQTFV